MRKYLLGQYEKSMPNELSLQEKLQYSKQLGFDYLEISIDESSEKLARLDWDDQTIQNLKNDMETIGQPIKTMCLSGHRKYPLGHPDKTIQEQSLNIAFKAIDLAERLGIRIIQLAGYDVYYEPSTSDTKAIFADNLAKVVAYGATKGILLGFETMETPFMDTVEKAMEHVNRIQSPYLGVYPDIGNLKNASILYQHSVNDDLNKGKGHLYAAHLKETKPGIYREIPFGEGHSEFMSNIEMLKKLNVHMFTGEWWAVSGRDWRKDCQEAHDFLRDKLDKCFEK